jgi:hypothetical protein
MNTEDVIGSRNYFAELWDKYLQEGSLLDVTLLFFILVLLLMLWSERRANSKMTTAVLESNNKTITIVEQFRAALMLLTERIKK